MGHNFINITSINVKFRFVFLAISGLILCFCKEESPGWEKKSQELLAADYIAANPDQFSEFEKLIVATGMKSLLNVRGPFTVFLPNNDAMFAYYKLKNVNSLAEFSDSFKKELIGNHIIGLEIPTDDMGLGTFSKTNAIGDYLVCEFEGPDIIISKFSKIIKRNIRTANGYIHVINRVLDPVTKDIFSVISADPSYKIFTEGLKLTGIKDTLQLISFPYGKTIARTRFTILAVADSIYNRYGIYNVNDLIKWCGASPDSLTSVNNPFNRYIGYHCLNDILYLSDLETDIYQVLSGNNLLSVTVDTDYKINFDSKTKKYTGFNIPASNIPAKNGALHSINDILPVTEPEPIKVTFETTEFFELTQGDFYGKYYQRFYDGNYTFAKIHWEGDNLLYFYRPDANEHGLLNCDCLKMDGWWTISITFPCVIKGKYNIYLSQANFATVTNCVVYVDGVMAPYIYTGPYGNTGGRAGEQKIAEVDFPTTAEHTITLRNIAAGALFWDYVRFDPVK
jgi:uncharacterized surface protein with fasciclin (FAS1) repeats